MMDLYLPRMGSATFGIMNMVTDPNPPMAQSLRFIERTK